jgi:NitT/TauT family transport system substrate-binding protein
MLWGNQMRDFGRSRRSLSLAFLRPAVTAIALFAATLPGSAREKIVFGTYWLPVAEFGGFYQAVADGTYAEYGLDVELKAGGPQVNTAQLLAAGAYDVAVTANSSSPLNLVKEGAPVVTIASIYQKDPQALMAHEEMGFKDLAELKGRPILVSSDSVSTFWTFLKVKYQFTDDQIRPYTFNMAPFLNDKKAIQQCYVTNEPQMLAKQGVKTKTFLLAEYGYPSYSALLVASKKIVNEKPDVMQRFVDATNKGWANFLHGDFGKAREVILKANPDYSPDNFDASRAALINFGIVESGDSTQAGIGAMTDERWKKFFDTMVAAGALPASLDYKAAYTLAFVNKAKSK